jgi:hypothetical protein
MACIFGDVRIVVVNSYCGSGPGPGSARTRNFLQDPYPEIEVIDPNPSADPELDLNLTESHKKIINLIMITVKIHQSYIFIEKDALKCHEKTFKIVGIVNE